jgi:hypothetical protein
MLSYHFSPHRKPAFGFWKPWKRWANSLMLNYSTQTRKLISKIFKIRIFSNSDSVIYRYRKADGDPIPNGAELGQLTSEVPDDEEIVEFASGKNWSIYYILQFVHHFLLRRKQAVRCSLSPQEDRYASSCPQNPWHYAQLLCHANYGR